MQICPCRRRTASASNPLAVGRVHRVRPELVAEVKFLAWTEDNLLRQVAYEGQREDKSSSEPKRQNLAG